MCVRPTVFWHAGPSASCTCWSHRQAYGASYTACTFEHTHVDRCRTIELMPSPTGVAQAAHVTGPPDIFLSMTCWTNCMPWYHEVSQLPYTAVVSLQMIRQHGVTRAGSQRIINVITWLKRKDSSMTTTALVLKILRDILTVSVLAGSRLLLSCQPCGYGRDLNVYIHTCYIKRL
jgi:hypothetical protein